MRVLVTNDDGIDAPGLHALATELVACGHAVTVVAPRHDCSGQGAAIGPLHITGEIAFERRSILAGPDVPAFAVDGTPALAVMAACLGGFGPAPEVVVSGVNDGANTGRAILHSGTVGAALTGLNFGRPGIAVSQVAGGDLRLAATAAAVVVEHLVRLARPVVLNINVPDVLEIRGATEAGLDLGGTVQSALVESRPGVLTLRTTQRSPAASTDSALLEEGWITVTPLAGPHAVGLPVAGLCVEMQQQVRRFGSERVPA